MVGAGLDRRHRVGHGAAGVVVAVDADAGPGRRDDIRDGGMDLPGQHPPVGVAQGDDLRTGVDSGLDAGERVLAVEEVAVEEVLGVDDDGAPLGDQVAHGVADHREVLLAGRPQRPLHVPDVRLRDERDDARPRVDERLDLRVLDGGRARLTGRAEGRERRVVHGELGLGPAEELRVVRVGPRPSPFDVSDAEVVEVTGDRQLVRDGEVDPLLLRAVAHRRVVDVERRGHLALPGSRAKG